MKGFGDFFSEARTSQASEKAKKLGLKGDGHGGWYDRSGELIAKTEKGDLKFYTKGQKPGKDQPNPRQAKAEPAPTPHSSLNLFKSFSDGVSNLSLAIS